MKCMEIVKHLKVPTGDILVVKGKHGLLEIVSLGDYGKDVNLKCDAIGLSRIPEKVKHQKMMPLTKKWVITISTQYGCNMGCPYCDAPLAGNGKNATFKDLIKQVITGLKIHPEIKSSERLNIHYARMGEPSWNPNILDATKWLKKHVDPEYKIHPVVSTIMPKNNEWLKTFIHTWMRMKNRLLDGEAGLQLSINSTDENERKIIFNNNALPLHKIEKIMRGIVPYGRKITLNFAIADYTIDPKELIKFFDPDDYIIKLTPMHKTVTALNNGIKTEGEYREYYPYAHHEELLKDEGYDVLVFIASEEEDLGRITCGNAIISGSLPDTKYEIVKK